MALLRGIYDDFAGHRVPDDPAVGEAVRVLAQPLRGPGDPVLDRLEEVLAERVGAPPKSCRTRRWSARPSRWAGSWSTPRRTPVSFVRPVARITCEL